MSTTYDAIIIGTGQAGPSLAARLTKAGQKVEAIYAYNRLTALHGQNEVTFFVPQAMRPEVNCTIRRKDWDRMETLLDELEARQF